MSKLRTLSYLKQKPGCEEYLNSVQNISDRIALTRFRLSNHNLMIEKGRHQNMNLYDRSCPFCHIQIEDEFHFLIKCKTYKNLREHLLDRIKTVSFGSYYPRDEWFLFWFLLTNPIIVHLSAHFIKLAMDLRAFLLDNPRNTT